MYCSGKPGLIFGQFNKIKKNVHKKSTDRNSVDFVANSTPWNWTYIWYIKIRQTTGIMECMCHIWPIYGKIKIMLSESVQIGLENFVTWNSFVITLPIVHTGNVITQVLHQLGWCLNSTCGYCPDSKVHGANMGPTGPMLAPFWPHVICYLDGHCIASKSAWHIGK